MPRALVEQMEQFRPVDVYPDNAMSAGIFGDLMTQWRIGPAGPTGIDYSAIEPVLRLRGVPRRDRPGMFEDISIMERAALKALQEDKG